MDTINLTQITIDGGTQMRAKINQGIVAEYADDMGNGAEFPPIIVFTDGAHNWLADGFHRYHAARQAGLAEFPVDKRAGTLREAILFAARSNINHGMRRSNADKRKAVMALLADDEWSQWSNREIARSCGVNEKMVRSLRENRSDNDVRTYTTKHGTEAVMKTEKIGRKHSKEENADLIRQLVAEGFDRNQIAEKLHFAPSTVGRYIVEFDIDMPHQQKLEAQHRADQVRAMASKNMTRAQIAEQLQMHPDTVSRIASRNGIALIHPQKTPKSKKQLRIIRQTVYSIRDAASNFTSLEPDFSVIDKSEAQQLLGLLLPAMKTFTQIKKQLRTISNE